MLSLITLRNGCQYLRPLIMHFVPLKDSKKERHTDEERIEIAMKIEGHIIDCIVYTVSSIWGYMICKD